MAKKPTYEELEKRIQELKLSEIKLKKAERGSWENEYKYQTLISNIPGMVYRGNPDWSTTIISNSEIVCSYSIEEFNTKKINWIDLIHPDDKKRVIEEQELTEKKKSITQEYRIITKDGRIRWLRDHKTFILGDEESVGSVDGVVFDITERKQAEEALRESEEKFKAVFDDANDGILVGDVVTKKFVMANHIICHMLGYTIIEFLNMSVPDIHPREELPSIIESFERQANKEFKVAENLPVKRKDGTIFYADINTSLITIGTKPYMVGIFRDITERKQAEEQKDRLVLELQKALSEIKTLSGFLPICSHCKKIRDDKGYWNQIESYIHDHSGAEFSHGICQECAKKYYPDMDLYGDGNGSDELRNKF